MRLNQLRKSWLNLSTEEKLQLVERTNERRLEAFEIVKNKRETKAVKAKRKKSRSSKKPKTAAGLQEFMKNMTPEERENFKLAILTQNYGD